MHVYIYIYMYMYMYMYIYIYIYIYANICCTLTHTFGLYFRWVADGAQGELALDACNGFLRKALYTELGEKHPQVSLIKGHVEEARHQISVYLLTLSSHTHSALGEKYPRV
jgi:hypothetical protein